MRVNARKGLKIALLKPKEMSEEKIIKILEDNFTDSIEFEREKCKDELLNLLEAYHKEKQRELLKCFCRLANITHDTVDKDIEDAINTIKNQNK